jgi:hypothetical protein
VEPPPDRRRLNEDGVPRPGEKTPSKYEAITDAPYAVVRIDGSHLRAGALGDGDSRGAHAASDVEYAALPSDRRAFQQLLCHGPAAGMDDAFSDYCHENVRIEPFDLGGLKAAALGDGHPHQLLSN